MEEFVQRRARAAAAAAVFAALAASGCINVHLFDGPPGELVETVVYGEGDAKILMLEIDGVITEAEDERLIGPEEESLVARVREQLDKAREDGQVRGLLLRINSPGGTATASDVIHSEIVRFKRDRRVPVVAQLMGVAASGGYYVATAADEIIAYPTTVTGSIGVLFLSVNFAGLMEKLGIEDQTLTAGDHKDAGSPLRRMTPEERAHIQAVISDLHARFKSVVAGGRPALDAARLEELADGSVFSAPQALENGLIDAIGGLPESVDRVEARAALDEARVVTFHRPREWKQNLYTRPMLPESLRLELWPRHALPSAPGFHYLWAPGLH